MGHTCLAKGSLFSSSAASLSSWSSSSSLPCFSPSAGLLAPPKLNPPKGALLAEKGAPKGPGVEPNAGAVESAAGNLNPVVLGFSAASEGFSAASPFLASAPVFAPDEPKAKGASEAGNLKPVKPLGLADWSLAASVPAWHEMSAYYWLKLVMLGSLRFSRAWGVVHMCSAKSQCCAKWLLQISKTCSRKWLPSTDCKFRCFQQRLQLFRGPLWYYLSFYCPSLTSRHIILFHYKRPWQTQNRVRGSCTIRNKQTTSKRYE